MCSVHWLEELQDLGTKQSSCHDDLHNLTFGSIVKVMLSYMKYGNGIRGPLLNYDDLIDLLLL